MPTITLTPDQQQALRDAQKRLHDYLADIDALEQCNDPMCQQLRAQNAAIRQQITDLQTQFGKNG